MRRPPSIVVRCSFTARLDAAYPRSPDVRNRKRQLVRPRGSYLGSAGLYGHTPPPHAVVLSLDGKSKPQGSTPPARPAAEDGEQWHHDPLVQPERRHHPV